LGTKAIVVSPEALQKPLHRQFSILCTSFCYN